MGSNGGGKSKLAGQMLASGYPRSVSIDVKGDFDPPLDYDVLRSPSEWGWRNTDKHIVYRPKLEYMGGGWLNEVLFSLFERARKKGKREPFVVYVDEGLYLSKTGHTQALAALAVSGRSLNVGLWVASQRPTWIPVEVRSEAWRWYVFYLAYEQDEREVLRYAKGRISLEQLQEGTANYSFWEIKRGEKSAGRLTINHFPPVRIGVPSSTNGGST